MPSATLNLTIDVVRTAGLVAAVGITALLLLWMERARLRATREIAARTQQSLVGMREMAAEIVALRDRLEEIGADGVLRAPAIAPVSATAPAFAAAPAVAAPAAVAVPVQPFVAAAPARSHDLAIRLARQGLPAEEIVAATGLTRSEAALVVRIHAAPARHAALETPSAA